VDAAEFITLGVLLVVLVGVLWRPFGTREWMWTVGGAAIVLLAGLLSLADAESTVSEVAGILAFLLGVAVIAELTSAAGVFERVAFVLAARARGSSRKLFTLVFLLTAFATSIFSLDGAVVVMTPVVAQLAAMSGISLFPLAFCVVFVANCGSLLFPVSNLTNLLAVQQAGLGFFEYTSRVWLAALLVLIATWLILRLWFRRELRDRYEVLAPPAIQDRGIFLVASVICAAMLPLFFLAGLFDWPVAYVALSAALTLAVASLLRGRSERQVIAAVPWQVLFFVLGLFLVVAAARDNGLASQANTLMTSISGGGFWNSAATTGISALFANAVNNLPGYLILAPAADTEQLYSVLIGVNAGPMLTPLGSLATVLWLHLLAKNDVPRPTTGTILKLGAIATPPILLAGVLGLWIVQLA
jgi:arsenical pump membrane protein